jgi:hypothetical protein
MKFLELFSTSEPIALFLNQEVAEFELVKFLRSTGAEVYPDEGFVGRLSSGSNHLWVSLCNKEITYLDRKQIEQIHQMLGAAPKSCVILELCSDSGEGVDELATYFIQKISQQWSCVLLTLTPGSRLYAANEILN